VIGAWYTTRREKYHILRYYRHRIDMAKKTFETALSRLESITDELEGGELSLEKSLKKFDEGIALVEFCNQKLEEAKTRVDLLLKKEDHLQAEPFEETF